MKTSNGQSLSLSAEISFTRMTDSKKFATGCDLNLFLFVPHIFNRDISAPVTTS